MSTSDDMRRMSEYERYRTYMKGQYGDGPWLPWKCRPDDNWSGWCESYALDPLTGLPAKTPAAREREEIMKGVAS